MEQCEFHHILHREPSLVKIQHLKGILSTIYMQESVEFAHDLGRRRIILGGDEVFHRFLYIGGPVRRQEKRILKRWVRLKLGVKVNSLGVFSRV